MVLRFEKLSPSASADRLTCRRGDGQETSVDLPREGVLPRLAIEFVVESTLGWHDGRFAALANLRSTAGRVAQSAAIAGALQADQWAGATEPAAFLARVASRCRAEKVSPPALTVDEVARLRVALREFGAAWRPLAPGRVLERSLPHP